VVQLSVVQSLLSQQTPVAPLCSQRLVAVEQLLVVQSEGWSQCPPAYASWHLQLPPVDVATQLEPTQIWLPQSAEVRHGPVGEDWAQCPPAGQYPLPQSLSTTHWPPSEERPQVVPLHTPVLQSVVYTQVPAPAEATQWVPVQIPLPQSDGFWQVPPTWTASHLSLEPQLPLTQSAGTPQGPLVVARTQLPLVGEEHLLVSQSVA
jgi:hypothetical protein